MSESDKKNKSLVPVAAIISIIIAVAILWAVAKKNSEDNKPIVQQQIPPVIEIKEIPAKPQEQTFIEQKNTDVSLGEKTVEQATVPTVQKPAVSTKSVQQIISDTKYWNAIYKHKYGTPAPDFTLNDLSGNQHKLSDYKGKNVLLVFWATWCPPCRAEIPELIKLRNMIPEDKLAILAPSDEEPGKIRNFAKQMGMNYTILLDDGKMPLPFGFQRAYRNVGVPCSFIIDQNGNIKVGMVGIVPLNETLALLEATN